MLDSIFTMNEVMGAALIVGFVGYPFLLICILGDRYETRHGSPPWWMFLTLGSALAFLFAAVLWSGMPPFLSMLAAMFAIVIMGGGAAYVALRFAQRIRRRQ